VNMITVHIMIMFGIPLRQIKRILYFLGRQAKSESADGIQRHEASAKELFSLQFTQEKKFRANFWQVSTSSFRWLECENREFQLQRNSDLRQKLDVASKENLANFEYCVVDFARKLRPNLTMTL